MKKLFITSLLSVGVMLCSAQELRETDAISLYKELANVVKLSDQQKTEIFSLYEEFVARQDSLIQTTEAFDADFHQQRMKLYLASKKKIYALLTPEQLEKYKQYRIKQREQFIAEIEERIETQKNSTNE